MLVDNLVYYLDEYLDYLLVVSMVDLMDILLVDLLVEY